MIGKKVRVFWPVDNSWYTGIVLQHDAATGEHLLQYEDEDTEWVKVSNSINESVSKEEGNIANDAEECVVVCSCLID